MQDERGAANLADPVTDGSPGSSGNVTFLEGWVYTSQAPLQLLDSFGQLAEGPGTQGALADVSSRQAALRLCCARTVAQQCTSG